MNMLSGKVTMTMLPDNLMIGAFYVLPVLAALAAGFAMDKPRNRHFLAVACAVAAALSPALTVNIYRAHWEGCGEIVLTLALAGCLACLLWKPVRGDVKGGLRMRLTSLAACLVYAWWTLYMLIMSGID